MIESHSIHPSNKRPAEKWKKEAIHEAYDWESHHDVRNIIYAFSHTPYHDLNKIWERSLNARLLYFYLYIFLIYNMTDSKLDQMFLFVLDY